MHPLLKSFLAGIKAAIVPYAAVGWFLMKTAGLSFTGIVIGIGLIVTRPSGGIQLFGEFLVLGGTVILLYGVVGGWWRMFQILRKFHGAESI